MENFTTEFVLGLFISKAFIKKLFSELPVSLYNMSRLTKHHTRKGLMIEGKKIGTDPLRVKPLTGKEDDQIFILEYF